MKLRVIAAGKLKDPGLEALCSGYAVRCRPFGALERVAVRDTQAAVAEAARAPATVLLDERGEQVDSPTLASWLTSWRARNIRTVAFAVGGADGFDDASRAQADRVLGLSRLTLPHRLAQVVLCEQLYRAFTILAGHPYHHA